MVLTVLPDVVLCVVPVVVDTGVVVLPDVVGAGVVVVPINSMIFNQSSIDIACTP